MQTLPDKWNGRFIQLAETVAEWSKDPSTKTGAVIVDDDKKVLSLGYNGFPKGYSDAPELYLDRAYKIANTIHAEHNAILNCEHDLEGSIIIATHKPCIQCAAHIISAGIKEVIWLNEFPDSRWGDSTPYFEQANIKANKFRS
jgi:dCMP deaminase